MLKYENAAVTFLHQASGNDFLPRLYPIEPLGVALASKPRCIADKLRNLDTSTLRFMSTFKHNWRPNVCTTWTAKQYQTNL